MAVSAAEAFDVFVAVFDSDLETTSFAWLDTDLSGATNGPSNDSK